MATNLPSRMIQLLIEKAIRGERDSGSSSEGLTKTPDLNLPPDNLSSFRRHQVDMKIGFKDGVETACCVCDSRKRSISRSSTNPHEAIANSGFILESSRKSMSPAPAFPQTYMFVKQFNSLLGLDGSENLPSLVCMGCVHCHMFIMVSESAPKCPKCKSSSGLLDISRLNEPMNKRARMN